MEMKYIVISVDNERVDVQGTRSIPIIFPSCFSHSAIFKNMVSCINMDILENDNPFYSPKILSAGFVMFTDNGINCYGSSTSLEGIKSRKTVDADLITNYKEHHESIKPWEYN